MKKTPKTPSYQLEGVKRYRETSTKWTIAIKDDTPRAVLLQKAKDTKELPERFWAWLEAEFDAETGWKN